jgi:hypothetical protein
MLGQKCIVSDKKECLYSGFKKNLDCNILKFLVRIITILYPYIYMHANEIRMTQMWNCLIAKLSPISFIRMSERQTS